MKNKILPRFLAHSALIVAVLGALAPVTAQARGRSTTVHGARGGTLHRQVNATPGSFSASGSATRPSGQTASRSAATQRTETGRMTSAQATGFNGKTATYDSTRTVTDTGYIRQAIATGPNGATAAKQVVVSNRNGIVTRSVTTTTTPPKP